MRLLASRLLLLALALLAVVPATAGAATAPKVTSVSPLNLKIGQRLTIKGTGFLPGKNRNTVVFKASGQRAVFVKAVSATRTKLVVTVPAKIAPFLEVRSGVAVGTRFKLRVLAKKLSKTYTPAGASPTIAPATGSAATTTTPGKAGGSVVAVLPATAAATAPAASTPAPAAPQVSAAQQCQTAAAGNPTGDQDSDGMLNGDEIRWGVDPCDVDSDGDTMTDGYEYEAARDVNSHDAGLSGRPYPGLKPWPNPLYAADGSHDFDGDGLTLKDEYTLWHFRGHDFPLVEYSDGMQASGGRLGAGNALDLSGNGFLTDDERDADDDGLSNVVELHYRGIQSWWKDAGPEVPPYTLRLFSELDPTVRDSDGDGVKDGDDDQDVDGFDNVVEMQQRTGDPAGGPHITPFVVEPYNPCMPNPHSNMCSRYIPVGEDAWRPFREDLDDDLMGQPVPFTFNAVASPDYPADVWDGQPGHPDD